MLCASGGGRGSMIYLSIILVIYYGISPSSTLTGITTYIVKNMNFDKAREVDEKVIELIIIFGIAIFSVPFLFIKNLLNFRYIGYIIFFFNCCLLITLLLMSILDPITNENKKETPFITDIAFLPTICIAFEY
jgi:amino acid permease